MRIDTSVNDRAAAGAAWLDLVYPEWWRHVRLDVLDMGSGCRCVAGQTFGGRVDDDEYVAWGFDVLANLAETAGEDWPAWVMQHGFLIAGSDTSWQPLDQAWRGEILRRRHTTRRTQPQGDNRHDR